MSCGELGPIDGGLIKNSTIQNSTVTGSSITNGLVSASDLEGCNLKGTASVDAASARTIADAVAGDQQSTREIASAIAGDQQSTREIASAIADDDTAAGELASAILGGSGSGSVMQAISNSNPAAFGNPQAASDGDDLPMAVHGARDALLGKPDAWMKLGDYVVPLYRKA